MTGQRGDGVIGTIEEVLVTDGGLYVTTKLNEYGYAAFTGTSRGDMKPLTRKQKRRYWRQDQMRKVGAWLYALANKCGYYHDCEGD